MTRSIRCLIVALSGPLALFGVWALPGVGAAAAVVHPAMHPMHKPLPSGTTTSLNWGGYDATGQAFDSVAASWVQPAVKCNRASTYSSFWAGLDGDTSNSVEQTGTEADCSRRQPVYFGWYEMYPAAPVAFADPLQPGDAMSASVSGDASGNFTLTLTDHNQGWTETENLQSSSATRSSAEVMTEAPSSGGTVLPLANFGTVTFTGVSAATDTGPVDLSNEIVMAGRTVKAQPGPLGGGSFNVTWEHS